MKHHDPATEIGNGEKLYVLGDTVTLRFVPERHLFGKTFVYLPKEATASVFDASGQVIRNDPVEIKDEMLVYTVPPETINKVGEYTVYFDVMMQNDVPKVFHVNFTVVPRGVKPVTAEDVVDGA